eukprot:3247619-Amphidinium_carterae.2
MAAKLNAYGHYSTEDVSAANFMETWIQKYEVARLAARDYGSHIEPQKMMAIVQGIVDAVRNC